MDEFDETTIRKRGKKKLLKVTFEDGKYICYKSTTMTFMETLRRIGVEKLQDVYLEVAHIPLLSKSVYPQFKDYQKELVKGWYVMTQSDSEQKYRQLLVIKQNLNLDIKIEIGEDLETDKVRMFQKSPKPKQCLMVKFPDGEYIGGSNPKETYKDVLIKIGIKELCKRNIELGGKPLISSSPINKSYEEIEGGKWTLIPATTKEKAKYLKIISSFMRIPFEITIID